MRYKGVWCGVLASILIGCPAGRPLQRPVIAVVFPPQTVMTSGDYEAFFTENLLALQQCKDTSECAMAIFNLGFVYAYHKSPYYDPATALFYCNDLLVKYPQTPWAFHSELLVALLQDKLLLEQAQHQLTQNILALRQENQTLAQANYALEESQRRLQASLRLREVIARNLQERLKRSHNGDELQERLKRSREDVDDLQDLLKRSRDIDIELEKKTRELLR